MRIPGNELHHRHIATYGHGGDSFTEEEEQGCPLLYKRRYVDRDVSSVVREELTYGSVIHRALYLMEEETIEPGLALERSWDASLGFDRWEEAERDMRRVIERGGPLTLLHTLAVEEKLSAPLFDDPKLGEVTVGGIIDVLAVDSEMDDPVPNLYFVDYKTVRGAPSRKEVEDWLQGWFYAWLSRANAHRWFPEAKRVNIIGVYDAIKRYAIQVEYSDERLDAFETWMVAVAKKILRDDKAEPKLNPGCTWCPVRGDCPEWNGMPGDGTTLLDRLTKGKLEFRLGQFDDTKKLISKLKKLIDDTKVVAIEKIRKEGALTIGGMVWELKQGKRREITEIKILHELMGDAFYAASSVRLGDVDDWLEEHREIDPETVFREYPGNVQLKSSKADD